jgi:arylsulfatase A-like enzyme
MIADDWSYPHAGVYEDGPIETTAFDRIATAGVLFTNAYCIAPSCTPSRASLLTGKYPHQLEEGVNLWGFLPKKFTTYTQVLEASGYKVGLQGKGWAPGSFEAGGYTQNPAGRRYDSFKTFYDSLGANQPFCFWFGSSDPHRPYDKGSGKAAGLDPMRVKVPGYLPDVPEVRSDMLDYFLEVKRFDDDCGRIIHFLDSLGQLDNTIVIITSDNGMPFPRAKAGVYDGGSRIPLAVYWKGFEKFKGKRVNDFVSLIDLAPTILGVTLDTTIAEMEGRNLFSFITEEKKSNHVFLERERHAYVREGNLSYPMRAIRTENFLYINNLKPDRWPAGDPQHVHSVGKYGDNDNSPSKYYLIDHDFATVVEQEGTLDKPTVAELASLAFHKRPPEELYDLRTDPFQLRTVINEVAYSDSLLVLRNRVVKWREKTYDPRLTDEGEAIETYPYYGGPSQDKGRK